MEWPKWHRAFPLALLAIVVMVVARRIYDARVEARDKGLRVQALEADLSRSRRERMSLVRALGSVPLRREPLGGVDVASRRPFRRDGTPDGLYYALSPTCGACALNYPLLKAWAAAYPGTVTGIALDGDSLLPAYATQFGLNFPVLQGPEGRLVGLIPDYATPTTVLVSGGVIRAMIAGPITAADSAVLESMLSEQAQTRTP